MFYDQISRVFTYNGTQVFINGERKLVHGINRAGHPLYAQRTERAVLFFLIDGEQRQYLSTVNADTSVELSNAPAVLDQVLNADGSVSILQNKKFLSAAQTSNAFTFMPRAITMEKFFLSKSNFVDVSSENVFTVRTFFGTSLFLDDAFKLKHKHPISAFTFANSKNRSASSFSKTTPSNISARSATTVPLSSVTSPSCFKPFAMSSMTASRSNAANCFCRLKRTTALSSLQSEVWIPITFFSTSA